MPPQSSHITAPPATDGSTLTAHRTDSHSVPPPADPELTRVSSGESLYAAPSAEGAPGEPVPRLFGDYVAVRKIGEGGMGAVYLAEDPKLGRHVAIKTMRPELAAEPANRERFAREARAAAAVEHESIVPVWGFGEAADGSPYIAMPFLQGEMLADRLRRQPVAPLNVILKVAREVAEGLNAAHGKGFIHRDIKPGNIWLEGEPAAKELSRQIRRCKILDFGLARSVHQPDLNLTAGGAVMGTPAYMAPEQAVGDPMDHRCDLFSLGVVLYRMSTGQLPFDGATPVSVMIALATKSPEPLGTRCPNLPPALSDLIDRLLKKNPGDRPRSAAEVCATVRQIVKEIQIKNATSGTVPQPASRVPITAPAPVPAPRDLPATDIIVPGPAPRPASQPVPKPVFDARVLSGSASELPAITRAGTRKANGRSPARRARTPWYVAGGAFALLALVALGAVVFRLGTAEGELVVEIDDPNVEARVKNGQLVLVGPDGKDRYTLSPSEHNKKIAAGEYTVRVAGADGLVLDTTEFVLKNGDKVTVRVTLDPNVAKKPEPPKPSPVPAADPDRKGAEYLLSVGGTIRINGATEIKAAKDLPHERFQLTGIELFANKQVTDEGLSACAGCTHAQYLNVSESRVSEVGLAHFKGCKGLEFLSIGSHDRAQKFTDAGLAMFDACENLKTLWMGGTEVTDAGLAVLKNKAQFSDLRFSNSALSDAGLARLKGCPGLTNLWVPDTQVTAEGVAAVAKALPRCKIGWAGGTIEPTQK